MSPATCFYSSVSVFSVVSTSAVQNEYYSNEQAATSEQRKLRRNFRCIYFKSQHSQ